MKKAGPKSVPAFFGFSVGFAHGRTRHLKTATQIT
jgi:hypothetical protein